MAKTILFYAPVYDFTVEAFLEKLDTVDDSEDLIIKMNSPGGSVFAGWGMAAAISKRSGKTTIEVEGVAASMAFMFTLFADRVEALDVTSFMVHKASMYIENEDQQKLLDDINAKIKEKIKKKFNPDLFKEITGASIEDIFNPEKRKDVWITAKEAKKIGLVDKVNRLDPKNPKAYTDTLVAFSDIDESHGSDSNPHGSGKTDNPTNQNNNNTNQKNSTKMDLTKLKAEHPELYALVKKEGVEAEHKRVKAIMAFNAIDPEGCIKAVNDGTEADTVFFAEMAAKAASPRALEEAQDDSPEEIEAKKKEEEAMKTKNQEELEAFNKEVLAAAGIIEEVK